MKRILAFALAFVMLLGMIPVAYATEVEELPVEIPVAEQPAPETEPVAEETEPATEETEPVTEATEPVTEETEPATEATEPVTEETEPVEVQDQAENVLHQGTCGENVTWVLTRDGILTLSGTGATKDYTASDETHHPWDGYAENIKKVIVEEGITRLGNYLFYGDYPYLKELELGNTVSQIGQHAFEYLPITKLTLPDSVTAIGDFAFASTYLETVSIGAGLQSIGVGAFSHTRANRYTVSSSNPYFTTENGALYTKDMTQLVVYPCNATATTFTVNAATTTIRDYAFAVSANLTQVVLPDGLQTIGQSVFASCDKLAQVNLPDSLTSMGEDAFYHSGITSIRIPENFKVLPANVFRNCSNLKEVILPDNLQSIGTQAFDGCTALETISLPDTLTDIGVNTFWGAGLKEVVVPKGVTELKKAVFYRCDNLESVVLPEGLVSIATSALSNCPKLKSINLPSTLKTLGSCFGFSGFTQLTIPASVVTLDGITFTNCKSLESVTFLGNAPTMGSSVFLGTTTTVYYPQNDPTWDTVKDQNYGGTLTWVAVEKVCDHISMDQVAAKESTCTEQGYPAHLICSCGQRFLEDGVTKVTLADILLPLAEHDYKEGNCTVCGAVFPFEYYVDRTTGTVTIHSYTGDETDLVISAYIDGYPVTAIGAYTFNGCDQLTSVVLPDTLTTIGDWAFNQCKSLKTVTLPASLTTVSEYAFMNCSSLKQLQLPDTVTAIGEAAFFGCAILESAVLPAAITVIPEALFANCSALKQITFKGNVTSIGNRAFSDCSALESVALPESVTSIGDSAFYSCAALRQINLPSGLTEISDRVFIGCAALAAIDLPAGITSIGEFAFSGCSSLTEIIIPESVTNIKVAAFGNCTGLVSVEVPDSVTELGSGVFQACTGLKEVALPSGLTTISQGLFISCYALEAVDLPVGVTKIETNAFLWCESLQYVSLPLALTEIEGTTFNRCPALKCIRYAGTKEDRDKIVIGVSNDVLNDANWHYEGSCCTPEIRISLDSETQKPMVSWDAKPCLSMYIICRGESPDAVEEQIGMTDGTSWVDETAPHNGCYYTVTGIARDELTEATSSPANLDGKLASPKLTGESVPYSGKPVITWSSVYGAVKYEVYRATSATGKYSKVKTTTETTYLDSSASAAKTYFYKVKAIAKTASKNGPLSDYVSVPCLCAQPAVTIKLNTATGTPELSWQKVSGAVKYEILRASEDSEGYFDVVATQAGTTFKDTTAPADQLCRYLVIAHASSSLYRSVIPELQDRPSIQTGIGQPVLNTASDAATGLPVLTWTAVAGAAEYEISRAVKSSGTYEVICSTDGLRFMDEEAAGGKTYYYKLTAISEKGTRSATSASKAAKSICTAPVADITSDGVTGKPLLLWEKVEGAKKYEIYRATSESGKFSKVATTTALRYIDSKASFGKVYYYKIKAVAASTAYNSDFSQLLSRIVICAQPKLTVKLDAATGKPALTWTKVTGAKNYVVMRAGASGNFTEVFRSGSNATYVDASAVPDLTYQYKVLAEGETVYLNSVDSADPITVTAVCAQPVVTAETDPATGKPKLSWNAVSGGADYEIFRSTKKTGTYESVCATDGLRFIDEEAAGGKTYYYKVCAYTRMGNAGASSVPASVKSICGRPQVVCGVDFATGKPSLSWNAVSGAKKYEVYRATSETGKYSKISTTTKLSFVDTKAPIAKTFYYKVKAVAASSAYNSALTEAFSAPSLCPRPVVTLKVDPATGKPTLTWKKVASAVEYEVFRATKENGPYTPLATQTATSYTDEKAQLDSTVYYAVIAKAADASYHSYYSHAVSTTIACGQPVLNAKTDPATGLPTLTWEAVTGAAEYEIYRSTAKTGTYTEICATDGLRFVDTDTVIGKTYYYKLTAKTPKENVSVPSAPQSVKRTCGAPAVTVTLDEKGKPVLSWGKVEGAKKYEVYRATSETGKYSKVSTTSAVSYTDTAASPGKIYFYKVKAAASSSSYNSDYSNVVSCPCVCARPTLTGKVNTSGQPQLSWGKVSGASKYEILRSSEENGSYTSVSVQTGTSYTDTSATVDSVNWYKVRALGSDALCNSEESLPVSVSVACPTPVIRSAAADETTGKPRLEWDRADGVVSYEILRAASAKGTYTQVGTTQEDFYVDMDAQPGKTYYYKLIAVGVNSRSTPSAYKSVKCLMETPVLTISLSDLGNIQLSWTEVEGAVKYEVYRSTKKDSGFEKIKTSSTNYTFNIVPDNKALYYYKVRGVTESGSYSPFSLPTPTASVSIKSTLKMELNSTTELRAEYMGTRSLTWSSSDETVLFVKDGRFCSRTKEGTAVVTVTDGNVSAECVVTVAPKEVPNYFLRIFPPEKEIFYPGESLQLEYVYKGSGELTWSSTDPEIVSVSDTGMITTLTVGEAMVTVSDGEHQSKRIIRVYDPGEKTTNLDIWSDHFFYDGVTKVMGDYLYLKVETDVRAEKKNLVYTTTDQGIVSVEWNKEQDLYADDWRTWLVLHFNSPGTATVTLASDDREVVQSYTIHVKEKYDCDPGKTKLTPEEFAYYATQVGVEMGHTKSKVLSGYLYAWYAEEELTFEKAVAFGRGTAHRVYQYFSNSDYKPMLIVYVEWDEDMEQYLFYTGY